MRFQQLVAVVTGGGSGIGKATAERLVSEGASVVIVGRTKEKLQQAADEINQKYSESSVNIFPADVTKEEDVNALAEFVRQTFGELHVLINNAGGSAGSKILKTELAEWERGQRLNLASVFLVSKTLAPLLIETTGNARAIVNVSSLSGHKPGANIPSYSASKAAVINFSKALANELAPYGIRVNSVSPGFIETPLTEAGLENERFVKAIERNTALKRVGVPEEIANVITFAASKEASYMTGTDLLVDGGWLIT